MQVSLVPSPKIIVAATTVASFAVLFPVARHLDWLTDRQRPMYSDIIELSQLQAQAMQGGDAVRPSSIADDRSVLIHGREFVASRGVEVRLTQHHDGFCVQGFNRYGDQSMKFCGKPKDFLPGGRFHFPTLLVSLA